MCCKLLEVRQIDKPAHSWCTHAARRGGGCRIYAERPEACRTFECLWLQSQARPGQQMQPELRPDKSHVIFCMDLMVLEPGNVDDERRQLFIEVDPKYPHAWEDPLPSLAIRTFVKRGGTVHVTIGDRHLMIRPDGEIVVGQEADRALAISAVRVMMGVPGTFPAPTFDADELMSRRA